MWRIDKIEVSGLRVVNGETVTKLLYTGFLVLNSLCLVIRIFSFFLVLQDVGSTFHMGDLSSAFREERYKGGGQNDLLASTVLSIPSADIFSMPRYYFLGYHVLNSTTISTSLYHPGLHEFLSGGKSTLWASYLVRRVPYSADYSLNQNNCIYQTASLPCQPAKLFTPIIVSSQGH